MSDIGNPSTTRESTRVGDSTRLDFRVLPSGLASRVDSPSQTRQVDNTTNCTKNNRAARCRNSPTRCRRGISLLDSHPDNQLKSEEAAIRLHAQAKYCNGV